MSQLKESSIMKNEKLRDNLQAPVQPRNMKNPLGKNGIQVRSGLRVGYRQPGLEGWTLVY